mgnify:CR=1 FL=1
MIVNKIETPFRSFLESLKVPSVPNMKGGTLFSPDEINYLARYSFPSIYEFVQENEPDKEFLETFTQWLREDEIIDGYVDTYMIFYLRYAQKLSGDEFEYLERNIYLLFKTNTGNLKVRKNDIIYASFEKRKVALYTKKEKIYVNLVSLTKFFDLVKSCGNFIYINRSTVINLHYLTSISNYEANLSGILYPILISKEKYKEVTIRFMNTLPYNNY